MRPFFVGAAVGLALLLVGPGLAETPSGGYLNGASIRYAAPPRPSEPMAVELDLVRVRAAQAAPNSAPWREAAADAEAYDAGDIIRRFDGAVGRTLDPAQRPLLVAMLGRIITDTEAYANVAKAANPRPRPYVEDPAIIPCDTNYLRGTEEQAYPSGHAMNGYVTAIVLSILFPEHRQAILARGARYGDNRVVCGVHHPTDVEQGRLLGIAYFETLQGDKAFRSDLACASAEEALVTRKTKLPASCAASQPVKP